MTPGRRGARRLGALLVVLAVAIGALVTFVGEPRLDPSLVRAARPLRDVPVLYDVLVWCSRVGWGAWLVPASLLVGVTLVAAGRARAGLVVGTTTLVATMATRMLKEWFERARPEDGIELLAAGFSMPSGHSSSSAAFAASVWLATGPGRHARMVRGVVVAFAALTMLSRVVLGVHYPSDVIAGACLGAGIACLLSGVLDPRHRAEVG